MPYADCLEHVGNVTAVHCLPLYVSHEEHLLPFPGLLQYVGGISHLDLEAVSEVGHEGMVLLSALVDVFDQLLGPLLQHVDARVQRGKVGS